MTTLAELRPAVKDVEVDGFPLFGRGKVRTTYDLGDHLLMIASDRVSAFDAVMPDAIPDKGAILTQMSKWWFARSSGIAPNHIDLAAEWPVKLADRREELEPRSMLVRRAERIDIECIVRGYLAGSGWKEYKTEGTLAGVALPEGLRESEKLPEAQFTPSTKNDAGHDENINLEQMAQLVGRELSDQLENLSLKLYAFGRDLAAERGVLLADTKFEFGYIDGEVHLIDECFTPDSSRYWDAEIYEPGRPQPAMDKQFLRDYLETLDWDKNPPGPPLPEEIVLGVRERYLEAYRRVTGEEFQA